MTSEKQTMTSSRRTFYALISCWIIISNNIKGASSQTCTHQAVEVCTKRFVDNYGADLDAIFPAHSAETMNSICSDFGHVEECIGPIKPLCTPQDQEIWEGIENSFDYICSNNGLQLYNKNLECFSDATLQTAGRQCNTTFTSSIKLLQQELTAELKPVNLIRQDYCKVINQFLECIKEAVAANCNDEAANWHMSVDNHKFKPVFHQFGCTLYNELSPGATAGIIIACFVVFILILSPILYVVNRRRTKQATKRLESRKKQRINDLTNYSQMRNNDQRV